jgi:peptide/nickel transport system substrate-binding protein
MNATQTVTSRRRFLQASGTVASAAALAGALDACGGNNPNKREAGGASGKASSKKNGTIHAGISYELGTNGYDPMTTSAALTVAANWHTMEGLTEIMPTPDRKVYAALAKDMPQKVDDKTYEVTLRDGAKFHDGSDVTADDVVFSFERVLDPKNDSLYATFIPFIDSVKKKNDHSVTIKTKYPYSLVNERLAVVKIVPKAAVKKKGKKKFDANPVGTGPYKMTDNGAASKTIKFARFDDYSGPRPAKAKQMKWKIVPDESTRTNALQSKSVQAIDSVPYLSIKSLKKTDDVKSVQGFGLLFAMFNNGSKPFNELKNRQAVLYGIDYDKVIKTGLKGQGAAPTSFLPENHPSYKKASTVYTHQPSKSKDLIKQTGLKKIRMLTTDHDWVKKCTPIIKENLENAGIKVDFQQKQSADVYNTIDGKPDAFDLVIAPGDPSVFGNDADLLMRWWFGNDIWTDQRMHWKGSKAYRKLQKLLDNAVRTSGDKQQELWGQAFDLLSNDVPLYPLFHRKTPTAWDDKTLEDFKPISLTGLSFLDVGSTK